MSSEDFIPLYLKKAQAGYSEVREPQRVPVRDTEDKAPMTEEQLVHDASEGGFQQNANLLYKDFLNKDTPRFNEEGQQVEKKPRYGVLTDPVDIARWSVDKVAELNANFGQFAADYSYIRNKDPEVLAAFMDVWDSYDQTPNTKKQAARFAGNVASDLTTWMGLGIIGKVAGRGMPKAAFRSHLRNLAVRATPSAVTGAAEGAVTTGGEEAMKEGLQATNEDRDYNATVPMVYAGIGAVAGGALVGGVDMGVRYLGGVLSQKFDLYRGATNIDDPLATMNPNGSPTASNTPEQASQYGDVSKVTVNSASPTKINRDATADEIALRYDLSEEEAAVLKNYQQMLQATPEGVTINEPTLPTGPALPSGPELPTGPGLPSGPELPGVYGQQAPLVESPELAEMLRRRGYDLLSYDGDSDIEHIILQSDIVEGITPMVRDANLERWAGGAPIVDGTVDSLGDFATGKAVVVRGYHGTDGFKGEGIDTNMAGLNTGAPSAKEGFFMSGGPETAEKYTPSYVPQRYLEVKDDYSDLEDVLMQDEELKNDTVYQYVLDQGVDWKDQDVFDSAFDEVMNEVDTVGLPEGMLDTAKITYDEGNRGAGETMPLYMRFKNPYVQDYGGSSYREESYYDVIQKAKAAGHDGVILTNTRDGGPNDNIFVAFEGNNVKAQLQKGEFTEANNLMRGAAVAPAAAATSEDEKPKREYKRDKNGRFTK